MKKAFTLAEVLVTLGIIGVVAALTMPTLINNSKQQILNNQFKKAYSLISNAYMQSVSTLGYSPNCYYWASNPYGTAKCVSYSSTGECSKYQLANGSNLPSNYNGPRENCTEFANAILSNLKIIKTCAGNAYPDCIPEYAGNDTIKKANNDDLDDIAIKKATTGCAGWRKNNIAKSSRAYVLANGQILITYGSSFSPTIFAIDINGKKPPNKWGYDLFEFSTIGSMSSEVSMDYGRCGLVEKGGVSTKSMLLKVNK